MKRLKPDHHTTKLGSKDFVFQVNKWPFSITCNPALPVITECYIDLALVKDMKIAVKKIESRHISYAGYSTKLVGSISQTVQVVYDGLPSGTMHLKAKVVRNLSTIYDVDCIASTKLYQTLTDNSSQETAYDVSEASSDASEDLEFCEEDSVDDMCHNADDTPKSKRRKRRRRYQVCNFSFASSMMSTPERDRNTSPIQTQVLNNLSSLKSKPAGQLQPDEGHPFASKTNDGANPIPSYFTPAQAMQTYLNPSQPNPTPVPPPEPQPNPSLQLQHLIFCGLQPPCPCLDKLRPPQMQLLPPHYPVYLPTGQLPCGQDCGFHHVHGDNLHPPNHRVCPCDPPRLDPGSAFHCQVVQAAYVPNDDPPLPPDFLPCGTNCAYEDCGCLRQYEGCDWIS